MTRDEDVRPLAFPAAAGAAAQEVGQVMDHDRLVRSSLVLFARVPQPRRVKTRLVRPPLLDEVAVCVLYRAFLADCCAAGAASGIGRRRLYVADWADSAPEEEDGRALLRELAVAHGFDLCTQEGAQLGARMEHALRAELAAGAEAVVLIGTDAPQVPASWLRRAAERLLDGAQVVLGPAADGGYWLVGARAPCPALFPADMPWGSAAVLPRTLARLGALQRAGVPVALLPLLHDVDTPEDLQLLCAQLWWQGQVTAPHTTAALARLGFSP